MHELREGEARLPVGRRGYDNYAIVPSSTPLTSTVIFKHEQNPSIEGSKSTKFFKDAPTSFRQEDNSRLGTEYVARPEYQFVTSVGNPGFAQDPPRARQSQPPRASSNGPQGQYQSMNPAMPDINGHPGQYQQLHQLASTAIGEAQGSAEAAQITQHGPLTVSHMPPSSTDPTHDTRSVRLPPLVQYYSSAAAIPSNQPEQGQSTNPHGTAAPDANIDPSLDSNDVNGGVARSQLDGGGDLEVVMVSEKADDGDAKLVQALTAERDRQATAE
jgi:hypothetical protein